MKIGKRLKRLRKWMFLDDDRKLMVKFVDAARKAERSYLNERTRKRVKYFSSRVDRFSIQFQDSTQNE